MSDRNFEFTTATAKSKADEILLELTKQAKQAIKPLTHEIEISYFKCLISNAKKNVTILMHAVADRTYNDEYTHIKKVFTNIEEIETKFKAIYNMS